MLPGFKQNEYVLTIVKYVVFYPMQKETVSTTSRNSNFRKTTMCCIQWFLWNCMQNFKTQASILFKILYDSYSEPQIKSLYSFFVLMERKWKKYNKDSWSESKSTHPWEPLGSSLQAKKIKSLWYGMELGKKPAAACPFLFLQLMFVFSSDFLLVFFPTRKKQKKTKTRTSGKQIPHTKDNQIQNDVSNLNPTLKRLSCAVSKFNMQCQQYLIGI